MKKRVRYIRPSVTVTKPSGGKRFAVQTVCCLLILVLVIGIQHTPWSGTVQQQISRLYAYEIDFSALSQAVERYLRDVEEPIVENASTEPEIVPLSEPEPEEPSKWTLLNTGRITSRYGSRELDGTVSFHSGIDIAGNYGDDVFAIADGTVFETGEDAGYGNYIKIRHPSKGIVTLYGHLQSIAVKEGQELLKGAVIGAVGSTGRSNGPHLHLEVRDYQNHTLDPAPYIEY